MKQDKISEPSPEKDEQVVVRPSGVQPPLNPMGKQRMVEAEHL